MANHRSTWLVAIFMEKYGKWWSSTHPPFYRAIIDNRSKSHVYIHIYTYIYIYIYYTVYTYILHTTVLRYYGTTVLHTTYYSTYYILQHILHTTYYIHILHWDAKRMTEAIIRGGCHPKYSMHLQLHFRGQFHRNKTMPSLLTKGCWTRHSQFLC